MRAREALGLAVRGGFERAGYAPVSAPVLQPADIFLDMSGEDIRRRMYVFADPGGNELCLRPPDDSGLPPLSRKRSGPQRLCSLLGAAYRYQKRGSAKLTEFTQAGVECLGTEDAEGADAEVVRWRPRAGQGGPEGLRDRNRRPRAFDALVDALPARRRAGGRG